MQLRNYPKSWKIVKLENVLDRISNGIVKSQNKESHGTPVTRIETIKDEFIDPSRVGYLENVSDEEIRRFGLILGDILFSHINSESHIGKTAVYYGSPGLLLHGMNLLLLRANKSICDPLYLNYVMKYYRSKGVFIGLAARAVGQASINQGKMSSLEIPLPSLPEQRAIAHALRAVQGAREARLRELALERERKAALMEQLFTHGTRGEATKQTEIGEMPESWVAVKFEKLIASSAFGPRFSSDYYDPDGNVATLRTTDMDNEGNINYSTMPLAKLELECFEQHLLKPNDFLITRSGTCGIAAIFKSFEKPVLPGAFLIRFRLSNEINPQFLKYYVNSHKGRNRILQLAGGAVQKNLSGTSLRSFQIPLPLSTEQDAIVKSLIACDSKIAALENEAHLHEELFRAMLEELMSGRLPAGALVEDAA